MSYLVVTIKAIKDQAAFDEYAAKVLPLIKQHGGWYVAIDRNPEIAAGQWPYVRTVIVNFPTFEALRGWYNSAEYQAIIPLRLRAIDANIAFVHGLGEVAEQAA